MDNSNNKTNWGIIIENEGNFWDSYLINLFINPPKRCKYCNQGVIYLRKNNSIINPYLGKCNQFKCKREIYLQINTIFEAQNKTPASVLYNVIKFWLNDEFNAKKISNKLKEVYSLENVNPLFIYKFLHNCRLILANYIRTIYQLDPFAYSDAHDMVAVGQSIFSHLNEEQVWFVGLINLKTNDIRLEMVENRSSETLKKIKEKHVMRGNHIITDSWASYNFLDDVNSGYSHIKYNHAKGHFGYSSRIEGVWGEFKSLFKKIYSSIRSKNLLYFIREIEFRRLIKNLNLDDKLKKFSEVIECVGNGIKEKLLSDDELSSFNYDTFFDD